MRRKPVSCALLPDFGDLRGDPVVHHLQGPGLPTLESLRDEIRWEDENVAGLTMHGDLRAVLVGDDRPVEPEAVDKSLAEAETHGVDHVVRGLRAIAMWLHENRGWKPPRPQRRAPHWPSLDAPSTNGRRAPRRYGR